MEVNILLIQFQLVYFGLALQVHAPYIKEQNIVLYAGMLTY